HYDIWLLSPDGDKNTRITNGRETRTRFRICSQLYPRIRPQGPVDNAVADFNIEDGLILEATGDDNSSGFYEWSPARGLRIWVYGPENNKSMKCDAEAKNCICVSQTASIPPRLVKINTITKQPIVIVKSNPHHVGYEWSTQKLISFTNTK